MLEFEQGRYGSGVAEPRWLNDRETRVWYAFFAAVTARTGR